MKKAFSLAVVVLLLGILSAATARADTVYIANLSSAQEVPSNPTSGTGFGTVTLNSAENQILVNLTWQGLTGQTIMGHIHGPALEGVNAPVLIPFWTPTNPLPAAGSFTGSFSVSSTVVGYLKAGQLYMNIHTDLYPGGEIRGQLHAVPEPATMLLLGTGLAGLGASIRKRRKGQ